MKEKKGKNKNKREKVQSLLKKLQGIGVDFQVQKNEWHVKIKLKKGVFDVWPTTEVWMHEGAKGKGLDELLEKLAKENAK